MTNDSWSQSKSLVRPKENHHSRHVPQAAILYNLKLRHYNEKPYTRTGDIVIAVNPYQWYHDLYTEKKRTYYSNRLVWDKTSEDPRNVMEPHVYEVSALSYKGLQFEDQSILVSGESGAGKTETVKICLDHIASTQRGGYDDVNDPVVDRIVESNPLLEAFGNAQTRRNDNSSRFGKYMQLQFEKQIGRPALVGSKCEVYLLEKNRVVSHDVAERNFHIFYQLLAAPDSVKMQFWSALRGATNESFSYVGRTDLDTIEGKTDAERFTETLEALELVGVKGDKLQTLMQVLCIVLQLGNLSFTGDLDSSKVKNMAQLSLLAELMGVTENELSLSLTERTFQTRDETHKVPLGAEAAKDACDALAKEAYQKAFLWLVNAINEATAATPKVDEKFGIIGLLDIFGFEAFKTNRFEQLCINYANEKIQQKFNEDIFRSVQEEYKAEGIPLEEIWYDDNTDVLDLIEGRTGLLALLNEECHRPKGNDIDFVAKIHRINKNSPALFVHRTDNLSFGIKHYAGPVMYDAEFFIVRNQDTLPTDLQDCCEKSSNAILSQPRSEPAVRPTTPKRGRGFGKRQDSNIVAPTVWTKYRNQLQSLMTSLRQTRSRYIRCLKPNSQKAPMLMEHNSVVDQLRCAGVVAGITITRSVFPNRLENIMVLARYSNMWDKSRYPSKKTKSMSPQQRRAADCQALMTGALKDQEKLVNGKIVKSFVVGKTKTFFRAGALEWLESNRRGGLDAQATVIQKMARGWLVRNAGDTSRSRRRRAEEEEAERRRQADAEALRRMEEARRLRQQERDAERAELERRMRALEREIENVDSQGKDDLKAVLQRNADLQAEIANLEERTSDEAIHAVQKGKLVIAKQKRRLEEAARLIQFLKKENRKARKAHDKVQEKIDTVRTNQGKLHDGNMSMSNDFDDMEGRTQSVSAKNDALMREYENAKRENASYKKQVEKMQETYMTQAECRLELQKTMGRILRMIQSTSKSAEIVEDTAVTALECEAEAKAIMAALDPDDEWMPDVTSSDVSESEASYW